MRLQHGIGTLEKFGHWLQSYINTYHKLSIPLQVFIQVNICSYKNLYTNVDSKFIHNCKKKKKGKPPRCLRGEWINKWYVCNHTMENKLLICTTWMNIKYILLSKRARSKKLDIVCFQYDILKKPGMTNTWKCYCSVYY